MHSRTNTCSHTLAHSLARTRTRTLSRTHTHTLAHSLARTSPLSICVCKRSPLSRLNYVFTRLFLNFNFSSIIAPSLTARQTCKKTKKEVTVIDAQNKIVRTKKHRERERERGERRGREKWGERVRE